MGPGKQLAGHKSKVFQAVRRAKCSIKSLCVVIFAAIALLSGTKYDVIMNIN